MSVRDCLIAIGFDKNGEPEFGITMSIGDLSFERMQSIRALIPVAIAQAENIWTQAMMNRPENRGSQAQETP